MVLLAKIRRDWIHAVLRIARQGYYFAAGEAGSMEDDGIRWFAPAHRGRESMFCLL
jgi:hypothetical protein